jgi:hypothetical protein
MKKISVKDVVRFRNKKERSRETLLNNLLKKEDVKSDSEGGGDYWIIATSALSNAVKVGNTNSVKNKITEVGDKIQPNLTKQSKDMYEKNLNILHYYEDFNVADWLPDNTKILTRANKKVIVEIESVPVQISPSQVFYFEEDGIEKVGAIWFIAQLGGFAEPDLGIFAECLYIHLSHLFKDKYQVEARNCVVVEVVKNTEVNYQMILDNEIPSLLSSVLKDIRKVNGTL